MYPRQFTHLDGHNAYEVLGVGTWATRSDIELARRRLAGQVHPDLPTGDAARMSLVNAAAAILLDDTQRNAYDAYLASVAPARRLPPRPVDRTSSSTRDRPREHRHDPQRDSPADPHHDLNRDLFGDRNAVRDRSTRIGSPPGSQSAPSPPAPAPSDSSGASRTPGSSNPPGSSIPPGSAIPSNRLGRPSPSGRRRSRPVTDLDDARDSHIDQRPRHTRRDDRRPAEAWASEPSEPGRAERRQPSPGPSRVRTRVMGSSMTPPWDDEPFDGPRPPLRWQPPPPGAIARWRANRRRAKELARGNRPRRLKAGSPIPVLGLFVMIVAICAIGGAALGYRAAGTSSPTKSPTAPASTPAHPRPSPTAHHK